MFFVAHGERKCDSTLLCVSELLVASGKKKTGKSNNNKLKKDDFCFRSPPVNVLDLYPISFFVFLFVCLFLSHCAVLFYFCVLCVCE